MAEAMPSVKLARLASVGRPEAKLVGLLESDRPYRHRLGIHRFIVTRDLRRNGLTNRRGGFDVRQGRSRRLDHLAVVECPAGAAWAGPFS